MRSRGDIPRFVNTSTPGIVRDTKTGALINKNESERKAVLGDRVKVQKQNEILQRLDKLEKEFAEFKEKIWQSLSQT